MKNLKNQRRDFLKMMSTVAATMTLSPMLVKELHAKIQNSNYLKLLPNDPQ